MMDSCGTVASDIAVIILAPWRMMPCRSTSLPIMKPGTSAKYSNGTLNASHSQMNRAALSAESTNRTPPRTALLLATMPTGRPSIRPSPTTSSAANSGLTSKNDSASTRPSIRSCTSKGADSASGTASSASSNAGSAGSASGAGSRQQVGR